MPLPCPESLPSLLGFGFCLPGEPEPLGELDLSSEERETLEKTGQVFYHATDGSGSTPLMIEAARQALERSGTRPEDVGLVISAPSLLTRFGLEIPAVGIRAALKLTHARCLNLSQGCSGVLQAIDLAARLLPPESGKVALIATSAVSSTLTPPSRTHGAFFWGDGGAAVVTGAASPGGHPGEFGAFGVQMRYKHYAEVSADEAWDAMRIGFGDAAPTMETPESCNIGIEVHFNGVREKMLYVANESRRFESVISSLLEAEQVKSEAITALFLPSVGENRNRVLFENQPELREKLATDFRYAHMGGVDPLLFFHRHLLEAPPHHGDTYLVLSPAFTAQWGGVLFKAEGLE